VAGTTILFGVLMVLLGVVGYFATGRQSWTALIPAIAGAVFVLLGAAAARNARYRMHAMHVAALLALVGLIAMIPQGVIPLVQWLSGTNPARPAAIISRCILAALLLIFLVMCVKSFVDARRARRATPS
jgi:hypothetical protein